MGIRRRWIWTGALLAGVASIGLHWRLAAATTADPVVVYGAKGDQEWMVNWAVHRYQSAGLEHMPPLEIRFHTSYEACNGGFGFERGGRVDLCTGISTNLFARKIIVHEIAHAWSDANLSADARERFMSLREITRWNDWNQPWQERGFEQAAEVITWGVGEGVIAPSLSQGADPMDLAKAYRLLTDGRDPINPRFS